MAPNTERIADAERLAPYFAVQLLLAGRLATLSGLPFAEVVLRYTNLHRRFGLGRADPDRPRLEWRRFAARLAELQEPRARLDWTVRCYAEAHPETSGGLRFGCFKFDPPDPDGVVRIHFSNRDADDVSPLAPAKAGRRRTELAGMCAFIGQHHPGSKVIKGGSWLYNLEAYRRLFPPAYVASRETPAQVRLDGTSSWGQLLTHRGETKAAARDRILANLADMEPTAPWRVFPLPALAVQAPFGVFEDHFRLR